MDEKQARKILGLDPKACQKDAKKTFRELAKQNHPDNYANTPDVAAQAEARMKLINLAFHFLYPRLKKNDSVHGEKFGDKNHKNHRNQPEKGSFFSDLTRKIKSRLKTGHHFSGHSSAARHGVKKKHTPAPGPGFDQILTRVSTMGKNRARPGTTNQGRKRSFKAGPSQSPIQSYSTSPLRKPGPSPYENFAKYMELKRRVGTGRQNQDTGRVQAVEKISPVKKIFPRMGKR